MLDITDLYQDIIVDHNRSPRNFGKLENATRVAEGYNPLCGDRLTIYLNLNSGNIKDVRFEGSGCAISVASASLMTEHLQGKTIEEAETIFENFHTLLTKDHVQANMAVLGKLAALSGVKEYPVRVKCATLCWHTLRSALEGKETAVSTE
ncbi:MAG: SUF system NifU family Fe-S cluster assembly protein [Gammaproteobacteria bacterium]|nr:SUF system NifU family Fe-S cluster assembly protein [Gammaproteobacteria bacterium]MCI0591097.1 SUF system NifU family Fe-S cluster assembly protein [Gammaproteobacteria bacterium]